MLSLLAQTIRHVVSRLVRKPGLRLGVVLLLSLAIASLLLVPFLRVFLFEVVPADPWNLASASGLLLVATFLAALRPAGQAARVDPVVTLKAE